MRFVSILAAVLSKFCDDRRAPSNARQKRKALSCVSSKTIGSMIFDLAVEAHMFCWSSEGVYGSRVKLKLISIDKL